MKTIEAVKFHPVSALLPEMSATEFDALVEDIRVNGVLVPVTTYHGEIVDGRHRWRACERLGIDCPTMEWDGSGSLVEYVVSLNLRRRHLTEGQKAVLALDVLPLLAAEAKERQRASGGDRKSVEATCPQPITPKARAPQSRDKAAAVVGVSGRTVARVQALAEAAKTSPAAKAAFDEVRAGTMTANEGAAVLKQEKRAALPDELRRAPLPMPGGRFRVLVLDPPWKYEKRAEDITHRGRCPYPDMAVDEIAALPVREKMEDDAVVWLWTTNSFMREAYQLADCWGLEVKTILTWAKDRMGTGDWLRGKTEHCLLCTKGRPVVTLTNQTTLLSGPLREHSRKPDEFFALVESLCPGSKLEFFAREARPGWRAWGAETEKF